MSLTFLIVHPDHFTQRAIEVTLRDLHYDTKHARDGLDAIDQALDAAPDAIVLGTGLPGLDGLDVARALRALAPTKQIPILFITNDGADTEAVRHAGLSLVDWIQVPLDLQQVREHLIRLVREPAVFPLANAAEVDGELASISDPLTGLYARQYILHRLAYEAARATRYGQSLATIMLGIRNVQELQKRFEQPGADRILVDVSNQLRRGLRLADLLGRTAADEFLIIAPHTDAEGALSLAQRMQESIQTSTLELEGTAVQVQVSIGVAISSGTNLADNLALFARAEAALERARQVSGTGIVMG